MYRVLISAADESTRASLADPLRAAGYELFVVDHAVEVLQFLAEDQVDLVLLSVPPAEEFEVCEKIKLMSSIPVIVASRNVSFENKFAALKASADDFLPLPFEPSDLLHKVELFLSRATPLSGKLVIVWDPAVVDPEDYATIIEALGNLVRREGAMGIERVRDQGYAVPVSEDVLV